MTVKSPWKRFRPCNFSGAVSETRASAASVVRYNKPSSGPGGMKLDLAKLSGNFRKSAVAPYAFNHSYGGAPWLLSTAQTYLINSHILVIVNSSKNTSRFGSRELSTTMSRESMRTQDRIINISPHFPTQDYPIGSSHKQAASNQPIDVKSCAASI